MTKIDSTTSPPCAPPHYELLAHPLIHHPNESPTFVNCRDILDNTADLVDLFGFINIDSDNERGGLSAEAAAGLYWLMHMLKYTLRYISRTLGDLRADQDKQYEQLKQSAFIRTLKTANGTSKEQGNSALETCLSINRSDIDDFIRLLDSRPKDGEPADTSATELKPPTVTELSEKSGKDLSKFVNELFPQLHQLSDDFEKLLSSYYFSQQAIHALMSEGQEISKKELDGLIATEAWMNKEACTTQKKLDDIISWALKHRPPSSG